MKEIRTAMGYVETVGLAAAIAAADAALKAANVRLVGREISKGGGMVTVKLSGNVGAIRAAVAAAKAEGERVSEVLSARVIARPAISHGPVMGYNADTMGVEEWLQALGVQDTPVSVHRPEGTRRGAGIRRKAHKVAPAPVEEIAQESPVKTELPETPQGPAQAPETVITEQEKPGIEPVVEPAREETLPEVSEEMPKEQVLQQESAAETGVAQALQGEASPETAEETAKTETPKPRRRTSRRKTPSGEQTEGSASSGNRKRRTRRKKASDSENNETSGRS